MKTLIATLLVALPMAAQQTTITCASTNGQQQVCNANTRDGVLLVRETSNNICRQGETWSYDRRAITVSGGCSASFLTTSRRFGNGNGYGNNGYGQNGQNQNGQYNQGNNAGAYAQQNINNGRAILPQGLQVPVRVDQTVRVSQVGQNGIINGTLANDLNVSGQTIPAGSQVRMKVYAVQPLDLRLDSMTVNGQNYTVESNAVTSNAGGGGLGGFLNALAGATIQSGSVINFQLARESR